MNALLQLFDMVPLGNRTPVYGVRGSAISAKSLNPVYVSGGGVETKMSHSSAFKINSPRSCKQAKDCVHSFFGFCFMPFCLEVFFCLDIHVALCNICCCSNNRFYPPKYTFQNHTSFRGKNMWEKTYKSGQKRLMLTKPDVHTTRNTVNAIYLGLPYVPI